MMGTIPNLFWFALRSLNGLLWKSWIGSIDLAIRLSCLSVSQEGLLRHCILSALGTSVIRQISFWGTETAFVEWNYNYKLLKNPKSVRRDCQECFNNRILPWNNEIEAARVTAGWRMDVCVCCGGGREDLRFCSRVHYINKAVIIHTFKKSKSWSFADFLDCRTE